MIVTDAVTSYLEALRPKLDPVLAEMEARAAREGIPIVVPSTGALLSVMTLACRARRVIEVGTAIGVSTLYIARALPADGCVVSFEIDPERHAAACSYLDRAGLLKKADLRLQDAREGLSSLEMGTYDMAFIDGVKAQYGEYLGSLLPRLVPGGLLLVDNVLMSGTVAEGRSDGHWTDEQLQGMRAFNDLVLSHEELIGTLTPVGDGVLIAVRR